jgi:DNA-binding MarR family transcriptional regulator
MAARRGRASQLQKDIKQNRPFRSPGHEALIDLALTADVMHRRFAALVQPYGVTPQQYNVLRILRGAGADGLPTLDIADRMIEKTPGITKLIDRLEKRGWVTRVRCSSDRRQVHCRATEEGLALLARLDKEVIVAEETWTAALTVAEQKQLIGLLDRLRQSTTD